MEGEWEWTMGPRALTFMSRGCPGKVWGQVIENQPWEKEKAPPYLSPP